MRDPYSLEAEHGVLGAMFLRPELIDLLSADLATPLNPCGSGLACESAVSVDEGID